MNISSLEIRALEYLQNVGRPISTELFADDHAPIGYKLIEQLKKLNLIKEENQMISLSTEGKQWV